MKNLDIEEQSEILSERFEKGIKYGFGAFLILYLIQKEGRASSKELGESLRKMFPESLRYSYTSFYRLLQRLRDEFKLISATAQKKGKGPERTYYALTPLGKAVLEKIFVRYIEPLGKLKL